MARTIRASRGGDNGKVAAGLRPFAAIGEKLRWMAVGAVTELFDLLPGNARQTQLQAVDGSKIGITLRAISRVDVLRCRRSVCTQSLRRGCIDTETAATDRRPHRSIQIFNARTACKQRTHSNASDSCRRTSPAGMDGGNTMETHIRQQNRQTVGAAHSYRTPLGIAQQNIGRHTMHRAVTGTPERSALMRLNRLMRLRAAGDASKVAQIFVTLRLLGGEVKTVTATGKKGGKSESIQLRCRNNGSVTHNSAAALDRDGADRLVAVYGRRVALH